MIVRADTLYSNLPSSTPLSAETLPETVKRMIYASASAEAKEGGAEKALKFSAIWNKLERGVSLGATGNYKSNSLFGCQKLLSSPNPHLEFLAALSPINLNNTSKPTVAGSSRSSRDIPPSTFSSTKPSSSREPLADPVSNTPPINFDPKGKTKADIINRWRTTRCKLPTIISVPLTD